MADDEMTTPSHGEQEFDREISYKGLVYFAVGLAVTIILAAALMMMFSRHIRSQLIASDAPPPALQEARQPYTPPAPNLQTHFDTDIDALHAKEDMLLDHYAWQDRKTGTIRMPIERAMQIEVQRGFPVRQEKVESGEAIATEPDLAAAITVESDQPATPEAEGTEGNGETGEADGTQ